MPKKPDARYDLAKSMFLKGMKLIDIARELQLPEGTVRRWKSTHKWDDERSQNKKPNARKRGGQPGNHNATGPPRNQNARKHGLYSRWLPSEIHEIIEEMPTDPLEILWQNIQLQYAKIIRAQKLMYVDSTEDTSKDVNFEGDSGIGYNIQYAWDKEKNGIMAQSRAMQTLLSMIKEYDDMLHKNWELATDLQKARLENMKMQTEKLRSNSGSMEASDKVVIVDDIE